VRRGRRCRSSPARVAAPATLDEPRGSGRATTRERREATALVGVVDDEEVLDLLERGGRDVAQLAALAVAMRGLGDGEQAVVSLGALALVLLLGLDHADQPARRDGSRRHRFVGEDEDVERVAAVAARRRQEAEVIRKRQAERQDAG